jgi:hypothetical protein
LFNHLTLINMYQTSNNQLRIYLLILLSICNNIYAQKEYSNWRDFDINKTVASGLTCTKYVNCDALPESGTINEKMLAIRNATVQIVSTVSGARGTGTGVLIAVNNIDFQKPKSDDDTYRFYVLTAGHNFPKGFNENDFYLFFNNQHTRCKQPPERFPGDPFLHEDIDPSKYDGQDHYCISPKMSPTEVTARQVLNGYTDSRLALLPKENKDFALIEVTLNSRKMINHLITLDPSFLGWKVLKYQVTVPEKIFCSTHPKGSVKRILSSTSIKYSNSQGHAIYDIAWNSRDYLGIPENGSSGSGIVDEDAHIVAIFFAGPDYSGQDCSTDFPNSTRDRQRSKSLDFDIIHTHINQYVDPLDLVISEKLFSVRVDGSYPEHYNLRGSMPPEYFHTCFDGELNNCELLRDCGCNDQNPNCFQCAQWYKNTCPPCGLTSSSGGGTTACRGIISQIHPSGYCHSSANPVKLNYRINRSCNGVEVQWFKVVSETTMVATTDLTTTETGVYLSPNVKEYESTFNFATSPTFPYEAEYVVKLVKGTEILAEERFPITLYAPVTVNAGPDQTICLGSSVTLGGSPTATGGTGNYSYHWTSENTTASAWLTRGTRYSANPSFVPTAAGIYTYTLEARDGFACSASDVMTLTVINPSSPAISILTLVPPNCSTSMMSITLGSAIFSQAQVLINGAVFATIPVGLQSNIAIPPNTNQIFLRGVGEGCTNTQVINLNLNPCGSGLASPVFTASQLLTHFGAASTKVINDSHVGWDHHQQLSFACDLTIDTDITFRGISLLFAPGKRIILNGNYQLKFENASASACGSCMWEGIQATDGHITLTNSGISHAGIGIVLNGTARLVASQSYFGDNHKHIYIDWNSASLGSPVAGPMDITGTTFANHRGQLKCPHTGLRTHTAIEASNVSNGLNIGRAGAGRNHFWDYSDHGIWVRNTVLSSTNNSFGKPEGHVGSFGIRAENSSTTTPRSITVTGAGSNCNRFERLGTGVFSQHYFGTVADARFNDLSVNGIHLDGRANGNIRIERNQLTKVGQTGIKSTSASPLVEVYNNRLIDTYQIGINVGSDGYADAYDPTILIELDTVINAQVGITAIPLDANANVEIKLNIVEYSPFGIISKWMQNTVIHGNSVTSFPPPFVPHSFWGVMSHWGHYINTGIGVRGCNTAWITDNYVNTELNPDTIDKPRVGIEVTQSPTTYLCNNHLERCTHGIGVCGNSFRTKAMFNTMRDDYFGFTVNRSGRAGAQYEVDGGGNSISFENKWDETIFHYGGKNVNLLAMNNSDGFLTPFRTRDNAVLPFVNPIDPMFVPSPPGGQTLELSGSIAIEVEATNLEYGMVSCKDMPPNTWRNTTNTTANGTGSHGIISFSNPDINHMVDMINGVGFTGPYATTQHYQARQFAYRELDRDASLRAAAQPLQAFYTAQVNSNIEKQIRIEDAISGLQGAQLGIQQAFQTNLQLQATNVVEANHKQINHIRLSNRLAQRSSYTATQLDTIMTVARQCPLAGGNAVWEARGMYTVAGHFTLSGVDTCLSWVPGTVDSSEQRQSLESMAAVSNRTESGLNAVQVYPNPNDGRFSIQFENNSNEPLQIAVLNVMGQTVFAEKRAVEPGTVYLDINLGEIAAGAYVLQLRQGSVQRNIEILSN